MRQRIAPALLLGLLAAAPAAAQTSIWSATLTVQASGASNLGCYDSLPGRECSGALSDNDFSYGGADYTVEIVNNRVDGSSLTIGFSTAIPADFVASGVYLQIGGAQFAFADATLFFDKTFAVWRSPGLSWTLNQSVSLRIVAPPPQSSNADLSGLTASSAAGAQGTYAALTLAPSFSASTTAYAATVANERTHLKLTPTAAHAEASIMVAGSSVNSGSPSDAIAMSVGPNAITVRVTAENGATKDYTVTVTRERSSNADLSGLTASSAAGAQGTYAALTLAPSFSASKTAYAATVANERTHLKLTPTAARAEASIMVAGSSVNSGSPSDAIAMSVGPNAITVRVTAENGATKDYTVTVTRERSSNADLSGLTASSAAGAQGTYGALTLAPPFSAGTTSYAATVANERTHLKLTPTAARAEASITVAGSSVNSGSPSDAIALSVGPNAITVRVTAENGATKDYTVTVTRQAVQPPPPATPAVSLSASPNPVDEGSPVTVTATLSEALPSQVTIPLTITDQTADSGDRGALSSIEIDAGATSGEGAVTTNDDDDDDDETFTVALGTLPSSVTAGAPSSVEITIRDNQGGVNVRTPLQNTRDENEELPSEAALLGNYPNPFNPETTIRYALPQAGNARLAVYDLLGQEVAVLVDGSRPAGHHAVRFDGDDLPSGSYVYRLQFGEEIAVRAMTLVK